MDGDRDKAESAAVAESKMSKEPSTTNKGNADNPTTNPVKQAHSDDDSGCALEEYTWVPPGLKPDQVRTSEQSGVCGDYKSKFDGISMWPSFCCFPCSEN